MSSTVKIDTIDDKILHILIEDARTSLKDIAKICNLSSASVLNRIKRLKKRGIITGVTLFPSIKEIGFQIVATIGIETYANTDGILKFLTQHTYLIEPSKSLGEYDLSAVIYAEDFTSINDIVEKIRIKYGVKKVMVNVWSGYPNFNFQNIDLQPTKKGWEYE